MRRQGIQLAYPMEEKRLHKWQKPYLCQPKLDGDRCRAVPTSEGYKLYTSEANEITMLPHLNEALDNMDEGLKVEFDGEIYNHELPHELIHGITSRTRNQHEESTSAEFHIFDCMIDLNQLSRINFLSSMIVSPPLFIVPTHDAWDLKEVMNFHDTFVDSGFEGIIVREPGATYVRKRSTSMMKFKPTKADWYEIVGIKEEIDKHGNPKDSLGALICRGDDETEFSVGSGLTQQQRHEWWLDKHSLVGLYCKVQYQRQNKGTPIFPVFLELDDHSGENHYGAILI